MPAVDIGTLRAMVRAAMEGMRTNREVHPIATPTLVVIGLDFHSAGLELRDRYAVPGPELGLRCQKLVASGAATEAVLVSTCNRTELYAALPPQADVESGCAALRRALGPATDAVQVRLGAEAATHLFRVASSLESMVLGEPQILGQVKDAFAAAQAAGTVGPLLGTVFNRAFRAAKQVRTDTAIARCAVSVGYVAVELAKTIFGDMRDVDVLIVGAGKMAVLAAKNLAGSGARRVTVANRTVANAEAIAAPQGWTAAPADDLTGLLTRADVVICSTGAPEPVLTRELVAGVLKKRRYRPLFLIDIAVPRDIDPACAELQDVYAYDIDDLEAVSRKNAEQRVEAAAEGERIVAAAISDLESWLRQQQAGPTIRRLREKALAVARIEAARTIEMLPELRDRDAVTIQKLAEVIAARLTRSAILALKRTAGSPEGARLAAGISELFGLEAQQARQ